MSLWAVAEASWISPPHHSHLPVPHDAPKVTPAPLSVASGSLPTGWPGASWLPPQDQEWSDKRWASAEQSSQLTSTKAGRSFSLHISLCLNHQWGVALALSSPQILPPSPFDSHHSLSDVLQSCLGTRILAEIKKPPKLFTFFCFSKVIFCCFNMLKRLDKGLQQGRGRNRMPREREVKEERAFLFKKNL